MTTILQGNGYLDPGPFYQGTKAVLKPEDFWNLAIARTMVRERRPSNVYLTATLDAAAWGAELAVGDGHGRIYRVEPTGTIEDDPNLTDKKFLGNPTRSYRTRKPLSSGRSLGMEGTLPRGAPENAGSP